MKKMTDKDRKIIYEDDFLKIHMDIRNSTLDRHFALGAIKRIANRAFVQGQVIGRKEAMPNEIKRLRTKLRKSLKQVFIDNEMEETG